MFKKTHKHHIKPRHMGGTDESANLIELSVEEHAEAHFKLYEKYGKEQDFIAWKMLSGQITTDQARRMAASVVMKQKTGILNSQFGSKWFNNGLVEKKFRVGEKPPVDWVSGRMKNHHQELILHHGTKVEMITSQSNLENHSVMGGEEKRTKNNLLVWWAKSIMKDSNTQTKVEPL